MGFFEGFKNGLNGNKGAKEILSMYKEEDEDALVSQADGKSTNYRNRAFENSKSMNGKYQCVRCKKWFEKGDIDIDHIVPQSKGGDSTDTTYNVCANIVTVQKKMIPQIPRKICKNEKKN